MLALGQAAPVGTQREFPRLMDGDDYGGQQYAPHNNRLPHDIQR